MAPKGEKLLANCPSKLFRPEENACVFQMLGEDCTTLVTSPANMFIDGRTEWFRVQFGALCLVWDAKKREHFLRFYCLRRLTQLFSCKVCSKDMKLLHRERNFIKFNSDGKAYSFVLGNTTDGIQEAKTFGETMSVVIEKQPTKPKVGKKAEEKVDKQSKKDNAGKKEKGNGKPKKWNGKLSPKDISAPMDPRRVQHLGSDGKGGVQFKDYTDDPLMKQLFHKMGEAYEAMLRDKRFEKSLANAINSHGGLQKFKEKAKKIIGNTASTPVAKSQKAQKGAKPSTPASTAETAVAEELPAELPDLPPNVDIFADLGNFRASTPIRPDGKSQPVKQDTKPQENQFVDDLQLTLLQKVGSDSDPESDDAVSDDIEEE